MNRSVIAKGFLLVVVPAVLFAAGCRNKEGNKAALSAEPQYEKKYDNTIEGVEGIKNAIKGYNQVVIDGNINSKSLQSLIKYALEYETSRVIVFAQEDRMKGRIMRSKLVELKFDEVTPSADKASAHTSERWEFDYIDLNTGKQIEPLKEMSYKLRYDLVRDNGKWLVGKLTQLENPIIMELFPAKELKP